MSDSVIGDRMAESLREFADCDHSTLRCEGCKARASLTTWAMPWIQEQDDEVERLLAIVARLPLTADGVPVVPGMKAWERNKLNGGIHSVTVFSVGVNGYVYTEVGGRRHVSTLHSTRAAAEAAGGDDATV